MTPHEIEMYIAKMACIVAFGVIIGFFAGLKICYILTEDSPQPIMSVWRNGDAKGVCTFSFPTERN